MADFEVPPAGVIASESDDRTANNAVRHAYRVLSDEEKAAMLAIKDAGAALVAVLRAAGASRETAIAITNAEQAVMWGVSHVTA